MSSRRTSTSPFYENPANIEQLKSTNPAGLPVDNKAERGKWPVTMKGAQDGTTRLLKEHNKLTTATNGSDWTTLPPEKRQAFLAKVAKGRGRPAQEMARRESEMAEQWITRTVMAEINLKDEIFSQEADVRKYVYDLIKKKVKEFYEVHKDNSTEPGTTPTNG